MQSPTSPKKRLKGRKKKKKSVETCKAVSTNHNILKAPNTILNNGEHVTDPVKIADEFKEYFTSINLTTVLPDHETLATSQFAVDIL